MRNRIFTVLAASMTWTSQAIAGAHGPVPDQVIAEQHHQLELNTAGKGFGPQSPRDIDADMGTNKVAFELAPPYARMNLCNIHIHKNAEHKGGEFTKYAGNGDGHGEMSGFVYSGKLSAAELAAPDQEACPSEHGDIAPGDTIEVHYVYSTAEVSPGPTLGSCFSEAIKNPELRVEAQVFVVVNDQQAGDFGYATELGTRDGLNQALHIPSNTGAPVQYAGSTTGPDYNEKGSPFLVTWSVRPKVAKVDVASVGEWCKGNVFKEDHAHGVRNLVTEPQLLSKIVH